MLKGSRFWLLALIAVWPLSGPAVEAEDSLKSDKAAETSKHPTVKLEKGPMTAAVNVKGIVHGDQTTELSVRPKAWSEHLIVTKAAEHGSAVKAGDVLVEFDTHKLEKAIRDTRQERDLAQLAIRQAELELPILEKQAPLDLSAAEREYDQAAEDLKRFLEVDRKTIVQRADYIVRSANFMVEYARDELKQLQKMYRDKDLTEETEQMILKRYKHELEMVEFFSGLSKNAAERMLKVDLPREEQSARTRVENSELVLARAREVHPLTIKQKRLALAKLRHEEEKAKQHLADLEHDLEALTVRSPADGIVYYGRFVRGQWMLPNGSQGTALYGTGQVNPGDVFVTVIAPNKLAVRVYAEEKDMPGLKPGLNVRLTPTALSDKRLPGKLARVGTVPQDGKFELRIELDGGPEKLTPGMTCSAHVVTARKEDALSLPNTAVFEDAAEDQHYVYVHGKSGKPQKKKVTIGITANDRTEIVDGLAEGDEVLAAKP